MANMFVRLPVCSGQDLEAGLEQVMKQVLPADGAPEISDCAGAYAVNMEFDHIRDVLMQDREVWEKYQNLYWLKKYRSYLVVCDRLAPPLREEFCGRMRQEFKRAMQLGQLRKSDFTAVQWRHIRRMADEALGYAGLWGRLRKLSPYVPAFVRQGGAAVRNLAAKAKSKLIGVQK